MAKKVERTECNMAPRFVKTLLVKVEELSISEDSGWRDVDPARVQEIYMDLTLGTVNGQRRIRLKGLIRFWI